MTNFTQNSSPLAAELARVIFQFDRVNPALCIQKGLRRSEFLFLAALSRNIAPGSPGIKASELSSLLEVTPGAVSHVLNELEKNGYVERISDPHDRRVVLIHPTRSGLEILEDAYQQMMEGLNDLVAYLGEKDSREFVRLFSRALAYFRQNAAARPAPEPGNAASAGGKRQNVLQEHQ
jgi:DNA-binding MarR family transcriptional regulator